MKAPAPTPAITPKSIRTLSAGELTGSVEVGALVEVVFVLVVEVDGVQIVQLAVVVVVLARTQDTPEQVYPGPNLEVQ